MSSNYCFQYLTEILGFDPFFALVDYFANTWYALLNRIQKKSELLRKFKRYPRSGLFIKKNKEKKPKTSVSAQKNSLKCEKTITCFTDRYLQIVRPHKVNQFRSQVDGHSVQFVLLILREYISKRNQENRTSADYKHWDAQNPANCMSGLRQYIHISCHSFSLPVTSKSLVPSHSSFQTLVLGRGGILQTGFSVI